MGLSAGPAELGAYHDVSVSALKVTWDSSYSVSSTGAKGL